MRLKLDENIPTGASGVAADLGLDADTVADEGLTGSSDVDVMAAATREGRFLVTLDRGLGDIRLYPPGTHPGVAVLRLDSQDAASTMAAIRTFLARDDLDQFAGCVVVVRRNLVRVRRPR